MRKQKNRKGNKINGTVVVIFTLVFVCVFMVMINHLKDTERRKDSELIARQQQYEEESRRTEALEEQRVYVQTKKYVEEEAKKIGFVYPDEIILKPENK